MTFIHLFFLVFVSRRVFLPSFVFRIFLHVHLLFLCILVLEVNAVVACSVYARSTAPPHTCSSCCCSNPQAMFLSERRHVSPQEASLPLSAGVLRPSLRAGVVQTGMLERRTLQGT
jgi:hypothetical protein